MTQYEILKLAFEGLCMKADKEEELLRKYPNDERATILLRKYERQIIEIDELMRAAAER